MPTGACGVNCDVCRLNLLGLCTSCGCGKSKEAKIKIDTMERRFGASCPILNCVSLNHKCYCLRDCNQFPCDNFKNHSYPFSQTYLDMQKRRREQTVHQVDPMGKPVKIPEEYWNDILKREMNLLLSFTLADIDDQGNFIFEFLNETLIIDFQNRQLKKRLNDNDVILDNPLLGLVVLTYFKHVDRLYPVGRDIISTKDMKQGIYFSQDHNKLKTEPVIRKFHNDHEGFIQSAKALKGRAVDMADAACVLYPFPRVPVYYLIWESKGEYEPGVSILFDRSIEDFFQPPIIWGLVNLLNSYLITAL